MKLEKISYNISLSLKFAFLLFSIVFFITGYQGLPVSTNLIVISVFVYVLIIQGYDHYKKNLLLWMILLAAILTIVCVAIRLKVNFIDVWSAYVAWFLRAADRSFGFEWLTVFLLLLLGTPIYSMLKHNISRKILYLITGIFLAVMIFLQYHMETIGVAGMFTFCFYGIMESSIKRMNSAKTINYNKLGDSLSPFVIGVWLVLCFFPTSANPIKFQYLKDTWQILKQTSIELITKIELGFDHNKQIEFGLSMSGYSEDGSTGGSVLATDESMLTIKTDGKWNKSLYLIGNVKNAYTEDGWEDTTSERAIYNSEEEGELSRLEFAYAIDRSEYSEHLNEMFLNRSITITYDTIKTNTLFHPLLSSQITVDDSKDYTIQGENVRFDEIQCYGTIIKEQYIEMNQGNEWFEDLLKESEGFSYDQWDQELSKNYFGSSLIQSDETKEKLRLRAQQIESDFTIIPESLSRRVRELAYEVTLGADTDYEKLKAIEAYLNTYLYTTTPLQAPEGEELVDYFLFETKEGYCTYFATAMALMARCVGIPTRYVQGFCVSTGKKMVQNISVSSNQAHAWVEAYLEGVGWIPFEPTAGYSGGIYRSWTVSNKTSETGSDMIQEQELDTIVDTEQAQGDRAIDRKNRFYHSVMFAMVSFLLGSIVFVTFYLTMRYMYLKRRYRQLSLNDRMYFQLKASFLWLKALGIVMEEAETLQQYFIRSGEAVNYERERMQQISDSYMKIRYHHERANEGNLLTMEKFVKNLEIEYKHRKGNLKYHYRRLKIFLFP